jgi:protocatechuate 3,4-dioxygenase beta subunit
MPQDQLLSRRQLLAVSAALSGIVLSAPLNPLIAGLANEGKPASENGPPTEGVVISKPAPEKRPTPDQVMGPFYPATKPVDRDADLTVIQGRPGKAKGQVIYLMGRVFNLKGEPIRGTEIEIWQANTYGRYTHPSDKNPAPLDPNFQGFGIQTTDSEGRFRFKTVKPGAYQVTADWTRPPHIHFDVTSKSNRLITQMYFEGEPLNEKDLLYKSTMDKESLLTKLMPPTKDIEPDALIAVWDIVLPQM